MRQDFYIVAIGASAGGNEAILEFFRNVPENPGVAFVIIRHLTRDSITYFPEMLQRVTSLEIEVVKEDTEVRPNKIFLLPGNYKMKISGGILHLIERPKEEKINYNINEFFKSLAEDAREKSIGVILSGYLDDGLEGAKHIESRGGVVIAQRPDSAQKDSMPLNVINRNHPEFILTPAEMPGVILEYIKTHSVPKGAS